MIPVPYIEYLNTRIRSCNSRLFTRKTYEDLLSGDNLGTITTFLLNQPTYSQDIEKALEGLPEREGLERGITDYFARCISNVLHMADGKARHLFEIALYSFDLKNLTTIILAHYRGLPFHKVRNLIIPCGSLSQEELSVIFNIPDLHEIALSLSRTFPVGADALRKALMDTYENEPVIDIINRLELYVYHYILKHLEHPDYNMKILKDIYRLEIDMKNIKSALKFVWEGLEPGQGNGVIFTRGGNINIEFLYGMSRAKTLDEAFEMVESTPFHQAVEKGIIYFAETGFLHEMERFFEEVFIQKTRLFYRFHPFGVGVFVGYVWSQFVELTNLRTIINGIAFKTGAGQMRKGLIYV